jgi:hypothetical protein
MGSRAKQARLQDITRCDVTHQELGEARGDRDLLISTRSLDRLLMLLSTSYSRLDFVSPRPVEDSGPSFNERTSVMGANDGNMCISTATVHIPIPSICLALFEDHGECLLYSGTVMLLPLQYIANYDSIGISTQYPKRLL